MVTQAKRPLPSLVHRLGRRSTGRISGAGQEGGLTPSQEVISQVGGRWINGDSWGKPSACWGWRGRAHTYIAAPV